ncbi:MAG TPA: FeoA family protein [Bryobacteraceae bacterium]|jgi:Fe2+ transport system protein FeoA|nr:FeoA family protein [Bryobacteraceae bacterium]
MQLTFNKRTASSPAEAISAPQRLAELQVGHEAVIDRLDLPEDVARRLMELGFLPGTTVRVSRSAPGGDPKVFQVDGAEVALRVETAAQLFLRR